VTTDSRRILVVDDEPLVLDGMRAMLGRMGFTNVDVAERAKDALEHLDDQDRPELILLDLNMPEVDGMAFVRGLVDRGYRGHLILVSGEDERILQTVQHLIRAHGIDVLGHLQKPVPKAALAGLMELWKPRPERRKRPGRTQYDADAVRVAIESEQLELHYQPKVSVHDGDFVGVEALVRWRHPVDGLVFPDQFIGVAEANGLIDALTRNVVLASIRQARQWREEGLSLRVAVNVSMDNLSALDFADFAVNAAKDEQVEPELLTLEITESRLAQDMRGPLETLTRLRIKRFGLAIDDFGTGHSSLAQLRDIPFDELKVDRSFVHGIATNETVRAIYAASIGMAKHLRMRVVAEGVEDAEDWAFLRSSGCDYAQGYFIGRPMPAADIRAWSEAWKGRMKELLA
jgi:EAL domain-containing protein (putative c-di-GMP-specific phosphodiesterase class I)/FixJ family two-component response regulator